MSGPIMIVDAIPTNRIVLKVKLSSAYYETTQAECGADALQLARKSAPGMILLGDISDMPMVALLRKLRADARTAHIPILAMVSKGTAELRLKALRAGADDVVNKPIDDLVLLARLRSLQRAREAEAEAELRESTHRALGLAETQFGFGHKGRVALLAANTCDTTDLIEGMGINASHDVQRLTPRDVVKGHPSLTGKTVPDVFVLALDEFSEEATALQMIPELRTRAETRHAAVLVIAPPTLRRTAATLLDMGANDLVSTVDISQDEMVWRIDKLMAAKKKADQLRESATNGLKAAATDPLTGLYNRRYAIPHLTRLVEKAQETGRGFAVLALDIDHFKQVNDTYGHPVGDVVLRDVAHRLRDRLRAEDMVARIGGEEFLIVLPDTRLRDAMVTAQRLCDLVADFPFDVSEDISPIRVTVSLGIAASRKERLVSLPKPNPEDEAKRLLSQADKALYEAKSRGRNKVELFKAA